MESYIKDRASPGNIHQNSFAYQKNTSFASTKGREKDGLINPTKHN